MQRERRMETDGTANPAEPRHRRAATQESRSEMREMPPWPAESAGLQRPRVSRGVRACEVGAHEPNDGADLGDGGVDPVARAHRWERRPARGLAARGRRESRDGELQHAPRSGTARRAAPTQASADEQRATWGRGRPPGARTTRRSPGQPVLRRKNSHPRWSEPVRTRGTAAVHPWTPSWALTRPESVRTAAFVRRALGSAPQPSPRVDARLTASVSWRERTTGRMRASAAGGRGGIANARRPARG